MINLKMTENYLYYTAHEVAEKLPSHVQLVIHG